MSILAYILLFTLLSSVLSLIGGLVLLFKEKFALKFAHLLLSLAAGILLGTAFLDLLPEAAEEAPGREIFLWALIGILVFFSLERFVHWFHHHDECDECPKGEARPLVPLIILGDSVHNFIDGMVIAATFLVSVPLGIVTSIAVAAHEIPQEIGDFAILRHQGLTRKKVILVNLFSALTALAGAVLIFLLGAVIGGFLPALLALTAGFFIYISASDLIPEIHRHGNGRKIAFLESFVLLAGVMIVWVSISLLE
jgi:zinc and cadmium transporter